MRNSSVVEADYLFAKSNQPPKRDRDVPTQGWLGRVRVDVDRSHEGIEQRGDQASPESHRCDAGNL